MVNTDKIIVIGDKVLIRPAEGIQKTNSGLYLPPSVAEKEKVQGGYILKTGPGYAIGSAGDDDEPWKERKENKYISLQCKPGDYALYLRKDSVEIEYEKEKLVIVPHNAILLLIRDEDLLNIL
ncbi:MAG TPA: co-chaperone GroES family protein [Melioribacteraceae bacterium]|nr:co-chaperone GroES family protein [Melioribacteraceae bacterium]